MKRREKIMLALFVIDLFLYCSTSRSMRMWDLLFLLRKLYFGGSIFFLSLILWEDIS